MPPPKEFDRSVFINCPFDRRYLPILHAIVFAIHDAGFRARCALELLETGEARLVKILRIIAECRYGVHDLSRVEKTKGKYPRYNMPFELGLFLGAKTFGDANQNKKLMLVLDSVPYRVLATISDLGGQDAEIHQDDPERAIEKVRNWLRTSSKDKSIPGGKAICRRYRQFRKDLPAMLKANRIGVREIQQVEFFSDYRDFVVSWLEQNGR